MPACLMKRCKLSGRVSELTQQEGSGGHGVPEPENAQSALNDMQGVA